MRLILLTLFLSLTLVAGNTTARQIQKWTDENGRVHYGDYTEKYDSKTLNVKTSPATNSSASADTNSAETRSKLLKSMQDSRLKKKEEKDQKNKQLALMKKNCGMAKSNHAMLNNGGRLVTYDENGERHFIEDKERAKKLSAASKDISRWCK